MVIGRYKKKTIDMCTDKLSNWNVVSIGQTKKHFSRWYIKNYHCIGAMLQCLSPQTLKASLHPGRLKQHKSDNLSHSVRTCRKTHLPLVTAVTCHWLHGCELLRGMRVHSYPTWEDELVGENPKSKLAALSSCWSKLHNVWNCEIHNVSWRLHV